MVIISYKIFRCKRRTADYMPALLVDYENVSGSNGLKGADALCEKDTLIIFIVIVVQGSDMIICRIL